MSLITYSRTGVLTMTENKTIRKALVGLAIEKALLGIGAPIHYKVIRKLESDHSAYIFDCFERPEILCLVLKELYGSSSHAILESITKNLDEFSDQESFHTFLDQISVNR